MPCEERKALLGHYMVGEANYDANEWGRVKDSIPEFAEACACADENKRLHPMHDYCVYDDQGRLVYRGVSKAEAA